MDNEMKKWIGILSIAAALAVLLMLLLSGFDLSGIRIYKGIKIG